MNYSNYYSGAQQPSSLLSSTPIDEWRRQLMQTQRQQQMSSMPAEQLQNMGQRAPFTLQPYGQTQLPGPPRFATDPQRQVSYRGPRRVASVPGAMSAPVVMQRPGGVRRATPAAPPAPPVFALQPYTNQQQTPGVMRLNRPLVNWRRRPLSIPV